jgi:membrane protein YqaA with SNARE-associated domain
MRKLFRRIGTLLVPSLGPLGLFVAAFLDSSFLSLFEVTDFLVVRVAAMDPRQAWWGVLSLTLGSVCGCSVLWWIGHRGGEALLAKRFGKQRADRARAAFERWDILVLAIPAILPPPVPFKIFVLAAGVFGCKFRRFAITVTLARAVRYSLWAVLGALYGREAGRLLKGFDHWCRGHLTLFVALAGCAAVALLVRTLVIQVRKPGRGHGTLL